jgi:hypothetical protein
VVRKPELQYRDQSRIQGKLSLMLISFTESQIISGHFLMVVIGFRLFWERRSVGQSVFVLGPNLEPMTTLLLLSNICGLHALGCPPWREDGSVIYSYNLLSLSSPSSAELMIISYCLMWDSPNLEGQVPVCIPPRNRVTQLYHRALGPLFVASYDSQGYGGGNLTRLHTGQWLSFLRNVLFIP